MTIVRAAAAADGPAIRAVLLSAFPTAAEADLVERLEKGGDVVIELIAEKNGTAVGYVLLSRITAVGDEGQLQALGLAPVAVLPDCQGLGIGTDLIDQAIAGARGLGTEIIFVLGDPEYYGRFGFEAAAAAPFASPYAGDYLQALWLVRKKHPTTGRAHYPPAFEALE